MDSIVARASSGVTSSSMVASPSDLDVEPATLRLHRLQFCAADAPETEFERAPHDRLLDRVRVGGELVADRGANEVGAIGIEAFAHQEIDMAEIDEAEVDRDLLALARPVSAAGGSPPAIVSILLPSAWMVYGWRRQNCKGAAGFGGRFASNLVLSWLPAGPTRCARKSPPPGDGNFRASLSNDVNSPIRTGMPNRAFAHSPIPIDMVRLLPCYKNKRGPVRVSAVWCIVRRGS